MPLYIGIKREILSTTTCTIFQSCYALRRILVRFVWKALSVSNKLTQDRKIKLWRCPLDEIVFHKRLTSLRKRNHERIYLLIHALHLKRSNFHAFSFTRHANSFMTNDSVYADKLQLTKLRDPQKEAQRSTWQCVARCGLPTDHVTTRSRFSSISRLRLSLLLPLFSDRISYRLPTIACLPNVFSKIQAFFFVFVFFPSLNRRASRGWSNRFVYATVIERIHYCFIFVERRTSNEQIIL